MWRKGGGSVGRGRRCVCVWGGGVWGGEAGVGEGLVYVGWVGGGSVGGEGGESQCEKG